MTFQVLDLFSGIGGFSLGLERTGGFKTVAFCEIDSFCRRVLAKHWPEVPCYHDIRELTSERLATDGIGVDVICGGFPCQDISVAGKRVGMSGERSGLWSEYARLIGEIRPRYVIVENVAALLYRGLGNVLGDLAALGYDAEWHCIPASAIGAPHQRDRIWIMAYPNDNEKRCVTGGGDERKDQDTVSSIGGASQDIEQWGGRVDWSRAVREDIQNPDQIRLEGTELLGGKLRIRERFGNDGWWAVEPDVGRVADGVSARVDRLSALGNAVVPQIPELIGRAIMDQPGVAAVAGMGR